MTASAEIRRAWKRLRDTMVALTIAFTGEFVITCCIQYTLDPHQTEAFADYARRWPPIIERCGGDLIGYWLPKEGANNFAVAMIEFESLAAYEVYRRKLPRQRGATQCRGRSAGARDPGREPLVPAATRSRRRSEDHAGRPCVGHEDELAHLAVLVQHPVEQRASEPGALMSRPHQQILHVTDRDAVGDRARQADQRRVVIACGDDEM